MLEVVEVENETRFIDVGSLSPMYLYVSNPGYFYGSERHVHQLNQGRINVTGFGIHDFMSWFFFLWKTAESRQ